VERGRRRGYGRRAVGEGVRILGRGGRRGGKECGGGRWEAGRGCEDEREMLRESGR